MSSESKCSPSFIHSLILESENRSLREATHIQHQAQIKWEKDLHIKYLDANDNTIQYTDITLQYFPLHFHCRDQGYSCCDQSDILIGWRKYPPNGCNGSIDFSIVSNFSSINILGIKPAAYYRCIYYGSSSISQYIPYILWNSQISVHKLNLNPQVPSNSSIPQCSTCSTQQETIMPLFLKPCTTTLRLEDYIAWWQPQHPSRHRGNGINWWPHLHQNFVQPL